MAKKAKTQPGFMLNFDDYTRLEGMPYEQKGWVVSLMFYQQGIEHLKHCLKAGKEG